MYYFFKVVDLMQYTQIFYMFSFICLDVWAEPVILSADESVLIEQRDKLA